ncbi:hypothetical protein RF11_03504 [Thelohanellus kitauei]|uniref:ISXO2-like transposase domain-containing protein n=1 Tax=Thelohanellus kitauei TaxID=669202 RepID=A0A0C2NHP5_THEKT|nr:hypothetical protein RF11_03504 [Thelohanellus kitauei]
MCLEICVLKLFQFPINPYFLLGGEGVTIEIDEAKFGRRMYHRGRRVKRETPEGPSRALLIPVSNQTREKLFSIIQRWIKAGIPHVPNVDTTVISDDWASYLGLDQMVNLHLIINHSQTFVDPTTGAHTNTIEGNWKNGRYLPPYSPFLNPCEVLSQINTPFGGMAHLMEIMILHK